MTDEEYIRAGAELADGWAWEVEDDGSYLDGPDMGWHQDCISIVAKDALAAQLVRQVDALDPLYVIHIAAEITEIYLDNASLAVAGYSQDDRTMNTIKVIVDSGVLKNE